jgi:DNA-binding transcriptional ArsR family regulator
MTQKSDADKNSEPRGPFMAESIAEALGHPRRLRILADLLDAPSSATSLSGKLKDGTPRDYAYHLKILLKTGAIVLMESRKVRGATENIFALSKLESWQALARVLASLDLSLRSA